MRAASIQQFFIISFLVSATQFQAAYADGRPEKIYGDLLTFFHQASDRVKNVSDRVQRAICPTGTCSLPADLGGNYALHPCTPSTMLNPLSDLFAVSCTCKLRQVRSQTKAQLQSIKHVEAALNETRAKIASSPEINQHHSLTAEEHCNACLGRNPGQLTFVEFQTCLKNPQEKMGSFGFTVQVADGLKAAGWKPVSGWRLSQPLNPVPNKTQCIAYVKSEEVLPLAKYVDTLIQAYQLKGKVPRVVDEQMQALEKNAFPQDKRAKADMLFNGVKERAQKWLTASHPELRCNESQIQKSPQEAILCSFNKVKWSPPASISHYADFNAYHDNVTHTVEIGGPFIEQVDTNPAQVEFTMAHEVGHALFALVGHKIRGSAFERCLRSSQSVEAAEVPEDQLEEAFADWYATENMASRHGSEPTAENMKTYFEMPQLLCDIGKVENDTNAIADKHPVSPRRISRIIGAHPSIRKVFGGGETSEPKHCTAPVLF